MFVRREDDRYKTFFPLRLTTVPSSDETDVREGYLNPVNVPSTNHAGESGQPLQLWQIRLTASL